MLIENTLKNWTLKFMKFMHNVNLNIHVLSSVVYKKKKKNVFLLDTILCIGTENSLLENICSKFGSGF